MSRISWGESGTRLYEIGVDRGVLYVDGQPGVPWNGLTSISESPTGGDAKPFYVDGFKYMNTSSPEEFEATLTAFTYPDEFAVCDGTAQVRPGLFATQQRRKSFGLSYRTMIGNEHSGDFGYKVHLVYNVLASSSNRDHKTLTESPSLSDFSWKLTSLPPDIVGYNRTSHFILDSRSTDPTVLFAIESILYGDDSNSARLPGLAEMTDLIDTGDTLTVIDNGDGTFTMIAPASVLMLLDPVTFQLTWPTAVFIDDTTYTVSS